MQNLSPLLLSPSKGWEEVQRRRNGVARAGGRHAPGFPKSEVKGTSLPFKR